MHPKGNKTINNNLKKLASSTLTFQEGAETLSKGLKEYTNGVSQVNSGAKQLNDGVSQLTAKVRSWYPGTKTHFQTV